MPYDHASFYEVFKWDSIFQPSYKIVDSQEKNNQILVSVTHNSIRNDFLKNKSMTCQYLVSFIEGKISNIEEKECTNVDWNIWQKEVSNLVSWTGKNHPELNGFIHDMTMKGALNYLEAIELYEAGMKDVE